jgi:predicted  nucleic acid-binding Zn-ribbon protein
MNDASIELLRHTNEKLTERLVSLEEQVDELREDVEAVRSTCRALEAQANAAVDLASAIRAYLSWREQPPPRMAEDVYGEIERRFRYAVEEALRSVEP